jgi:hypothetical protein
MLQAILILSVIFLVLCCAAGVAVWTFSRARAALATTIIEVGASTGDAETTAFKANFREGESLESQKRTLDTLYSHLMARRKWSHDEFERIKREKIAQKEAEMAAEAEIEKSGQVAQIRGKPPKGA